MKGLIRATVEIFKELLQALPKLVMLLMGIIRRICKCEHRNDGKQPAHCLPIPAGVYLRPDASIYSQRYLMSLGMAVTWDNPDVKLTDGLGNVVGSHDLKPATPYTVTATIHNRSNEAPAPGMPVLFSLLSFGVSGTTVQSIGSTVVDLPVRGAAGEPVQASITWTTPPVPGHYCIQIEAIVADDANPLDNLGQHNTVVQGVHHNQLIKLTIPVRNTLQGAGTFAIQLHSYRLPEQPIVRGGLGGNLSPIDSMSSREPAYDKRESDASLLARVVAPKMQFLGPKRV